MSSRPSYIDYITNGDLELRIYYFENPNTITYWLKGGVGFIEFSEEDLKKVYQLLKAYYRPSLRRYFKRKKL